MMWEDCNLYSETIDEEITDQLGNPEKSRSLVWSGCVRSTPWDNQQLALTDREVTKNEQLYAVPAAFEIVKSCKWAELSNVLHKITAVTDMGPRWTVIQVKVYKHG